jgi:GNAT superfamily N-acetyltransferase
MTSSQARAGSVVVFRVRVRVTQGPQPVGSYPDRALRALLAPGAVTVVALAGVEVVGFAHAVTDSVTTDLAELLVTPGHRGRGVGRALIAEVFSRCGTERIDLLTDTAEGFYAGISHRRFSGSGCTPVGDAVGTLVRSGDRISDALRSAWLSMVPARACQSRDIGSGSEACLASC